jgi:nucleoside-diphosphate-sugar epimerase
VLDASGLRGVVIAPGVAFGDGASGIPGLLLGSPRDGAVKLIMLGTGQQHWSTVHVADLADLFRRALEDDAARGLYVVDDGLNPTVAELTEAAAVRRLRPLRRRRECDRPGRRGTGGPTSGLHGRDERRKEGLWLRAPITRVTKCRGALN